MHSVGEGKQVVKGFIQTFNSSPNVYTLSNTIKIPSETIT